MSDVVSACAAQDNEGRIVISTSRKYQSDRDSIELSKPLARHLFGQLGRALQ